MACIPSEAAVELLIAHGSWLRRRDFLAFLVDAVDDGWWPRGAVVPMTSVDWERAETFLAQAYAASSEVAMLRLAASLAGAAGGPSLLEMTGGLDDVNAGHVLEALAHRFGWHERATSKTVTTTFGDSPSSEAPWSEARP